MTPLRSLLAATLAVGALTFAGPPAVARDVPSPATFTDASHDVTAAKLDIGRVVVKNKPSKVIVRVYFPGVEKTYDYPTGAVSVFLDTDPTSEGAEFGHFMDFFSDYRFAVVKGWREKRTRAWSHDPEGRCVADAGLLGDKGHKLRWFQYVVKKHDGCFGSPDAVRVAVTTINTGDLDPYVSYGHPAYDYLGDKHEWTDWVTVS